MDDFMTVPARLPSPHASVLPALVAAAGDRTSLRFLEFFAANTMADG
jgi:hypothetical protein